MRPGPGVAEGVRRREADRRFMALARHIGASSKDRSTQVGCVIVSADGSVLSTGYHGFPRGVDETVETRHQRPEKYLWTEHAERNAIYNAAREGIRLKGGTLYLSWFPCTDCARALVQVGIETLVALRPDLNHATWGEHFRVATALLEEGGVRVIWHGE
jgi:dCMP deaminase